MSYHPNSSAAWSQLQSTIRKSQIKAMYWLRHHPQGATASEAFTAQGTNGYWKRLSELEELGHVKRLGSRKCKVTGMKATVWKALV